MAAPKPDGWHTLTPRIFTDDPDGLVAFLKSVFGASGEFHGERPAEIRIGDSMLMVSGISERPPMGAFLYVYVEDVDDTHERAVALGATSTESPRDLPYGDRRCMVTDRWGNTWQIATRL